MATTEYTIDGIRTAIADGKTTAGAIVDEFYTRIKQEDPEIGAFLTLSKERATAKAVEIDKLAAAGSPSTAAGRRSDRNQGRNGHARRAHHRRIEDSRKFRPSLRLHRSRAAGSSGRNRPGQT